MESQATSELFHENLLLIFVGHSGDANEESQAICDLEREFQHELHRLMEVTEQRLRFSTAKVWEWNYDAKSEVGGQETVITPYLSRANIAVFVFKERVGQVTWRELEECRFTHEQRIPIIAVFPSFSPEPSRMTDRKVADEWAHLLAKKEELVSDWTHRDSSSIRPVEDYRDREHLKQIVLDQIKGVLGGLLRPSPSQIPASNLERDDSAAVSKSFVDQVTDVTSFDAHAVTEYRRRLRDEARIQFPETLSEVAFLMRTGYLYEGRLNHAGVLLFTLSPHTVLSNGLATATTRCTIYHGLGRAEARNRKDIAGPVYDQIIQAYDFVAASVDKVELPTQESVTAPTDYRYPMACIREIIANALCHRDYDDDARMTYVRIYSDRIEVWSPGSWGSKTLPAGPMGTPLHDLLGEPVPPNFRLARGIASINIIEMEGSGIPTAIKDCEMTGAPEPIVFERDGYVVVEIYPRDNWPVKLDLEASQPTSPRVATTGRNPTQPGGIEPRRVIDLMVQEEFGYQIVLETTEAVVVRHPNCPSDPVVLPINLDRISLILLEHILGHQGSCLNVEGLLAALEYS